MQNSSESADQLYGSDRQNLSGRLSWGYVYGQKLVWKKYKVNLSKPTFSGAG